MLSYAALVTIVFQVLLAPSNSQLPLGPILPFLKFYQEGSQMKDSEPPDTPHLLKEYDFIVVGAGTAGCAVANRLTEIHDWKVLLVEAGGQENFAMDIPLLANYLQFTPINWNYKTKPSNKYCSGFDKHQCHWPRGKVMGGSSVLNYMIYTRGSPQDFDNWRTMGNEGWSWEDVLPYFKKVEHVNIPSINDPTYRGYDGHLSVEYAGFRSTKSKAWIKSAQQAGFKYNDYNGAGPSGASFFQLSMKNGTRHSSSRAYLHPIRSRSNLHVAKMSMVTKLIFDETKEKVIGIEMDRHNKKHRILAEKEVIVSAGAINSPQLLMLSGIGPKDHLQSLNIPVFKDLPVGKNLMDHIATGAFTYLLDKQKVSVSTQYIFTHPDTIFEWMRTHTGPISLSGGTESVLFFNLQDKFNTSAWPHIELAFITSSLNADPMLPHNFNFNMNIYNKVFGSLASAETCMVFPMLLRPKSKGHILLKDKSPYSHPIIIPNYFKDPEDMKTIVEGIKVAMDIFKQPAMKKLGARIYDVPIEECLRRGPFGSDEYFACQTEMFTFTIYHQSGTCKMGPAGDPTAVVDLRLRVHGIKGLRVIDASIMPEITAAHTNAPTYMIAEKGADMIKQDWNRL